LILIFRSYYFQSRIAWGLRPHRPAPRVFTRAGSAVRATLKEASWGGVCFQGESASLVPEPSHQIEVNSAKTSRFCLGLYRVPFEWERSTAMGSANLWVRYLPPLSLTSLTGSLFVGQTLLLTFQLVIASDPTRRKRWYYRRRSLPEFGPRAL
jgi:hypothetical protein